MAKPRIYTLEQTEFIKANYKGTPYRKMAEMLNEKFGTSFTWEQMRSYYRNHKLNSGLTGAFPKGSTPPNKGKKVNPETYAKMKPTMFKPGTRPPNWRPVGSERINRDGYIEIKVRDKGKRWDLKHRVIWERANGKVPNGYRLMFLDGNPLNCTLENIELVHPGEVNELVRNRLNTSNAELTRIGLNTIKLKRAIRRLKDGKDSSSDNSGGM